MRPQRLGRTVRLVLRLVVSLALGAEGLLGNASYTSIAQQQAGVRPQYAQPVKVDPQNHEPVALPYRPTKEERIVFLGNSLAERMQRSGHFETLLQRSFPDREITFRNLGVPGHTPAFRPDAGREDPWAFPGGEVFRPEIRGHFGTGHYPSPDEWLTLLAADTIVAFFGFNESFDGLEGVDNFKQELHAFVRHTKGQAYNGRAAPRIVLASPVAMEQHPEFHLPDAAERNRILAAYVEAIEEVAIREKVGYIDLFTPTREAFSEGGSSPFTVNGIHLSDAGYRFLAPRLFEALYGMKPKLPAEAGSLLHRAILDKNWMWGHDYRPLNGVHAYGLRWKPYGNVNYPEEIEKLRQMIALRDRNIWAIAQGKSESLEVDDSTTLALTPVATNFQRTSDSGPPEYLDEEEALARFVLPEGYQVSLFASEQQFPNLQNPAQMQFDNRGRLWVSVIPSYPHYRPGYPLPNDKILIYEDTDGDGRADEEIVFADQLHLPLGFQIAPDGIYVSEEPFLTRHRDLDGDDRADAKEYLMDGFDPHDTHHAISAFESDNGGGLFMCEGRFLHSQVETPYGPERMTDGGVWRFDPRSWRLERVFQSDVNNPWGVTHDAYGQIILNDASNGHQWWMLPYSMKVPHAYEIPKVERFNYEHRVRPTSGGEILSSRHFPDEVQGDYLFCNTIGFLGVKQFAVVEDGTALKAKHRQDLIQSSDGNFRPVDLEVAPDGSLYLVDWHNALIGHMQHSARDPLRNADYGRIYRITYPSRPLVDAPQIAGASVSQLFENLKLPELQARKRSQRELRGREASEVLREAHRFAERHPDDERLLLEALWATWGHGQPSYRLLDACLAAEDHRVRAAAIRVVRHSLDWLDAPERYLVVGASDPHGRVRLEAVSAASWLGGQQGARVLLTAASQPLDNWIRNGLNSAMLLLRPEAESLLDASEIDASSIGDVTALLDSQLELEIKEPVILTRGVELEGDWNAALRRAYRLGEEMYAKDGSCITCHQTDGQGLANVYPPLAHSEWVTGAPDRLVTIILHGLWGKIEVNGKIYDPANGVPPMTAFGGMYSDEEIAGIATYVRNSWGNRAEMVTAEEVARVREATKAQAGFIDPATLSETPSLEGGE